MVTGNLSRFARVGALLGALAVGGCANMMPESQERAQMLRANALDPSDPYEQTNRAVFNFNNAVYNVSFRPVGAVYMKVVPTIVRNRISSGINNLDEPRIFVNDVLQGRGSAAYKTFGRFLINSTLGVGGLFDIATMGGIERQTGDFGQTLYVYGVASGPYVVMPILGPATVRDGFGRIVDQVGDPSSYGIERVAGIWPTIAIGVVGSLERIDGLQEVEASSLDPYLRLRSIYLQKRASELGNAVGLTITPAVDIPTTPVGDTAPIPVKRPVRHHRRKVAHHHAH